MFYYRCQRPGCPTATIREDRLDRAICETLRQVQFPQVDAARLRREWNAWIARDDRDAEARALDLRIAKERERLTDLLVDGTIDRDAFADRKRRTILEIARLEEERTRSRSAHLDPPRMEKFLELASSLAKLHVSAKRAAKRAPVENSFSNRTVSGKTVAVEPSNWLRAREVSELSSYVSLIDTLLELCPAKTETDPRQKGERRAA